jgi:membrane protease YdiL (CAAX protease family)
VYWLQTFNFPSFGGLDFIVDLLTSEDPLTRFVFMFCVVVAAPIVEEVIFRGYLWRILEGFLPPVGVLLGTTIAFSAIHLDPLHVVGLLPTALFLGLLRARSGSIFPCILAHFVNNSLAMLTTYLISLEGMDGFLGGGAGSDDMIAVGACVFSFMCIGVVWWKTRAKP